MKEEKTHSEKRSDALKWWHTLFFEIQFYKVVEWLSSQKRDTTERHPDNLTGREIQEIYEFNKSKLK